MGKRSGSTSSSGSASTLTPTSWTSSAPVATGSPLCSAMPRQLWCALGVPQSFASPLEAVQGLLRAAALEGSSTKEHATGLDRLLKKPSFKSSVTLLKCVELLVLPFCSHVIE